MSLKCDCTRTPFRRWSLLYLFVVEAALFFRLRVGIAVGLLTLPILLALEWWREAEFDETARYDGLAMRVEPHTMLDVPEVAPVASLTAHV